MNKKQFTELVNEVLAKSPCNKPIKPAYLEALLPKLRDCSLYSKKALRPGLEVIPRMRSFGPVKQKFLVLSENGKELIVSKGKLIEALYPTKSRRTPEAKHRTAVLSICRRLTKEQLAQFRSSVKQQIKQLAVNGKLVEARRLNSCKLTGKSLNRCKTACDHVIPFVQLVDQWLSSKQLTFSDVQIKGKGQHTYFVEKSLMTDWQAYHLEHAELQMVCSKANSKAGAKGYKPGGHLKASAPSPLSY